MLLDLLSGLSALLNQRGVQSDIVYISFELLLSCFALHSGRIVSTGSQILLYFLFFAVVNTLQDKKLLRMNIWHGSKTQGSSFQSILEFQLQKNLQVICDFKRVQQHSSRL